MFLRTPPDDQLRRPRQYVGRQHLRCQACSQPSCQPLQKPGGDRLAGTQIRRTRLQTLHLMQSCKGCAPILIQQHSLFKHEDPVVSNPYMGSHGYFSRPITPSSFPGIRSISRLAAASVSHTTPSVRKPWRTLVGSVSLSGMMRFGWGVVSNAVSASSSKQPATASPAEKAASKHGRGGLLSMSCSPISSVNSGRSARLEIRHISSNAQTRSLVSSRRIVSPIALRLRRLRGRFFRHCGTHPSTSGTSYCSAFASPSYHSRSISTRSSASW